MKTLKLRLSIVALSFIACNPQTESRAHMNQSGQRMSDSIKILLDSCLSQPGKILAGTDYPIASSARGFIPINPSK